MNFLATVGNEGLQNFIENMEAYIGYCALILAYIIEVIGIVAIVYGFVKSFYKHFKNKCKGDSMLVIDLGQALAMGLTIKMGAEILKTIVVKTTEEIIILAAIIVLRAILAVLIHWELSNERKQIDLEKNEKVEEVNEK